MDHPLSLLKGDLAEWEKAAKHCLDTRNMEDYIYINRNKVQPLKMAIWLIGLSIEHDLKLKQE